MNNKELYDKVLDDLIDFAAPEVVNRLDKEYKEHTEFEFSEKHEEKMQKLFARERRKIRFQKISKYTKRIAVFFLVLVVASGITIFSVDAWRIRIMNFIIDMNRTHSDINFSEDNKGDTYKSDEISFNYIPAGFQLEQSDVRANSIYLKFKTSESYFKFAMDVIEGEMKIDTENASVKRLMVNGLDALYSTNGNVNILLWHDEIYSYRLSGNIEEKEMQKIAENIKK